MTMKTDERFFGCGNPYDLPVTSGGGPPSGLRSIPTCDQHPDAISSSDLEALVNPKRPAPSFSSAISGLSPQPAPQLIRRDVFSPYAAM
jgi:hypothetical protein